jgi:rhodanese-related sulfurtransferase
MQPDYPPQVSVDEFARRLRSADKFILLDVREDWELERARIDDARLEVRPVSRLARDGIGGLPAEAQLPETEIYVLCHLGSLSADVSAWLASQGWTRVFSVSGGIDEYARKIDPSVGRY